jgi:hypothetical protein
MVMATNDGSLVDVTLCRNPQTKHFYFNVKVNSVLKPQSAFRGTLDLQPGEDQQGKIGILAGAMAEELAARLNDDQIEPSACAKAAEDCYREVMRMPQSRVAVQVGEELPREDVPKPLF